MNVPAENFVYKGATEYLGASPQPTATTGDLIRRSAAYTAENPLYVVSIGAITNVAAAILLDPSIIGRIHVLWLGGHPLSYPDTPRIQSPPGSACDAHGAGLRCASDDYPLYGCRVAYADHGCGSSSAFGG